jgi:hypothetical protein
VPVPVIQEMAAALADPHFGPSRAEGFAAICAVLPTHHNDLTVVLLAELAGLDQRSWLFAFGGGIRIEQPDALRQELLQRCQEAIATNTKG